MDISQDLNNSNKKKKNFLTSKTIPNYFFLGSIFIILILIIVIIVISLPKSNTIQPKNEEDINKDNQNKENQNTEKDTENEGEEEVEEERKEEERKEEEESIEDLTPWEKYIKAEKYLYIWEYYTPDYIINLCKDHHFTRVYLSIGCIENFWDDYYSQGEFPASGEIGSLDYEEFIRNLNNINVEVELVTFLGGSPDDFTNIERVVTVANMVKELSKKVKIKALHFDQESGDDSSYENLLKMYIKVNEIFPASAILRPFWLKKTMKSLKKYFKDVSFYNNFNDCETLVDAIMKVTKFTDLMAYNQNYDIVNGYMQQLKTISERHPNNEAKNVIEISGEADVPEDDTLHQRFLEDNDKFFNFIYDSSKKYGGITIHYYEVWYKTLYCVWPNYRYAYDGGQPKSC